MPSTSANDILLFWFGDGDPLAQSSMWYKKDPQLDKKIRDRFLPSLNQAREGQLNSWLQEPHTSLAFVILLDQFSRNIFRDSPEAFSHDSLAVSATIKSIEKGFDDTLNPIERWFLYMPLMHSEDKKIQKRSIALFEKLASEAPLQYKKSLESALKYAVHHANIIFKFGRYPHRNRILERESTDEEIQFLKDPKNSF